MEQPREATTLVISMDDFDIVRVLSTRDHFTLFEAYSRKTRLPVVLKQCIYLGDSEAEFFIRSALLKTRDNVYSQPLVSIFASAEQPANRCINLVWKWGQALDPEVELDRRSDFSSGRDGYGNPKQVFLDLGTGVCIDRVFCFTLSQKVTRKIIKYRSEAELNLIFEEALILAKCKHPNICGFLDFRLCDSMSGERCAYIVTEYLKPNLKVELLKRKSQSRPFNERELTEILQDVTAALLHAKTQGIVHRDIRPSNIYRSPQGFKLAGFLAREPLITTFSVENPEVSPSSEGRRSPELQRSLESDVYSLGVTMLCLAALEFPAEEGALEQKSLCSEALRYSGGFKQLLTAMLSSTPADRPPLEDVRGKAVTLYRQVAMQYEEALRLKELACSNRKAKNYSEAIRLCTDADTLFSRLFPYDANTAINLTDWGKSLNISGQLEAAVAKYAAASAVLSRFFPDDRETADNFMTWGNALHCLGQHKEASAKFAAADAVFARFFPGEKLTAFNLNQWGKVLERMGQAEEARKKYAAADSLLFLRFPDDKLTEHNLIQWAKILDKVGQVEEAIVKYAAAGAIQSRRFSTDKDTADTFFMWGSALLRVGWHLEAGMKFAEADLIYTRLCPNALVTAMNRYNWGNVLGIMGNAAEAVAKYAAADTVLSPHFPKEKYTAINLSNWGGELVRLGQREEGIAQFAAADLIYGRSFPSEKETAVNLYNWGNTLGSLGQREEAVKKYSAAEAVLSRFFHNDEYTATTLLGWGFVLRDMGQLDRAVEKTEAARAVYASLNLSDRAKDCDQGIANITRQVF